MKVTTDELERPTEWLRHLAENRALYRQLLDGAGGLAIAAYRLARARCRVQPVPSVIPTTAELRVAANEIARYVGMRFTLSTRQLTQDCEHAGLPVIAPISASAA
ncbi:MAG: hypothetical protein IPI67_10925 [Myxococcales bacterium]|nr:hypothetical protein [Myxococcales bacterium]